MREARSSAAAVTNQLTSAGVVARWVCAVLLWLSFCVACPAQTVSAPPEAPPQTQPTQQPALPTAAPRASTTIAPLGSGKDVAVGLKELSPWSMFQTATLIVQGIMVGLAFASLVTWTIFIAKLLELFIARRRLTTALNLALGARTLPEAMAILSTDKSVMRTFVSTAINEERLSSDIYDSPGIRDRISSTFSEIIRSESRRIRTGMGIIATVAATSPFVGLFGTVWGIMNSFIGISKSQTTNLAVVAPGIAEALLATAIGLFAAIPAVVIYNHLSRATKGYMELVNRAAGLSARQLSRDFDRRGAASPMPRAAE
jgi:biopolymer transport protein ExbB